MNAMPSNTPNRRVRASWLGAAVLAAALGTGAAAMPSKAHAADVQVRVLVDVADLIFRSGRPYYYDQGYYQPVVVEYDSWHRPMYYRYGPRPVVYRPAPPPRYYYAPPPPRYAPAPAFYHASYGDRDHDRGRYDRGPDHDRGHDHDRDRGHHDRGPDGQRGRGW